MCYQKKCLSRSDFPATFRRCGKYFTFRRLGQFIIENNILFIELFLKCNKNKRLVLLQLQQNMT